MKTLDRDAQEMIAQFCREHADEIAHDPRGCRDRVLLQVSTEFR